MRYPLFIRVITIVCLLSFLPPAVGADMLLKAIPTAPRELQANSVQPEKTDQLPRSQQGALSGSQPGEVSPTAATSAAPEAPQNDSIQQARQLSDDDMRQIHGGPTFHKMTVPSVLPLLAKLDTTKEKHRFGVTPKHASISGLAPKMDLAARELSRQALAEAKGGQDIGAILAAADGLRDAGANVDAYFAYLTVLDEAPRSELAVRAEAQLSGILGKMISGEIPTEQLDEIETGLPSIDELKTVESRYAVVDLYRQLAGAAEGAKDAALAAGYHRKCQEAAWKTISDGDATHPLQAVVVKRYYEASKKLGNEETYRAGENLRQLVAAGQPSMTRWGARYFLAQFCIVEEANVGVSYIHYFDVLGDRQHGFIDQALQEAGVYPWVKAWIEYYLADSFYSATNRNDALTQLDRLVDTYPDDCEPFHLAYFAKCTVMDLLNYENPAKGIAACSEYLEKYPDGLATGKVLVYLGGIYARAEDYSSAADIYRTVLEIYPDTQEARSAEESMNWMIENNFLESTTPAATEAQAKALQMCGPVALAKLLSARGIEAKAEELAQAAGTDSTGTSMLGLIKAAEQKGLQLSGVEASEIEELTAPFIAFVNERHFVLVKEIRPDDVVVSGIEKEEAVISKKDFQEMWHGIALVLDTNSRLAALLDTSAMQAIRGGYFEGNPPNCPNWYPSPEECRNDGNNKNNMENSGDAFYANGSSIPSSIEGIAPPPAPSIGPGVPDSSLTTAPNGAKLASSVQVYHTDQNMSLRDISLPVRGGGTFSFVRTYNNVFGFSKGETLGTKPWQNNIGRGWVHNFNLHLMTSATTDPTTGAPLTLTVWDQQGDAVFFDFQYRQGGTKDIYAAGVNALAQRKADTVVRTVSTGAFVWTKTQGTSYGFSAPTADADRRATLEWIKDPDGNQITCVYDGASVATRKLTKITMPSPAEDTRYIELAYAPGYGGACQITRATLHNSAVAFEVRYAYNNNNTGNLTKFTDNDGLYNIHYYGSDATIPNSHYMTTLRDKLGNDTTFSSEYCSNGYFGVKWCTKLVMNSPNGLTTTYKRNNPSGYSAQCSVTCTSGATTLRKINYWGGLHGYFTSLLYFYNPNNSSDYRYWTYSYINDSPNFNALLTKVTAPGNKVYAQYTYTPEKRISTVTAGDGTVTQWDYDAGELYPSCKTGPDGMSTCYDYNANHQVVARLESGLSMQGYSFEYDQYGQTTKLTDSLTKSTTYAYNKFGQVTTVTNPLNQTRQMAYDDLGRLTQATDGEGKNTYYYYGGGCGGCGGNGLVTKITNALGKDTLFYYDELGRHTKVRDALGHEIDYAYDIMSNLTSVTDPSGSANTTTFAYDLLGRKTSVTDSLGHTTNYEYDYLDQITRVSDPVGTVVTNAYDAIGMLTTVTDGAGGNHKVTLAYDGALRLTKTTNGQSEVTWYKRDGYGRVTKAVAGASADFAPTQTWYNTDGSNLVSKVRYTSSGGTNHDASYFYDSARRLTSLTDWLGTLSYRYDNLNRLTTITDYDSTYLTYAYDARGLVTAMRSYSSGGVEQSAVTYRIQILAR